MTMIKVAILLFALTALCHGCGCGCGCCCGCGTQTCSSNAKCSDVSGSKPAGSCLLGLKSGTIPDKAITASSFYQSLDVHAPRTARLDSLGGWAGGKNEVGQWIQVSLEKATSIFGVVTQGRNNKSAAQWVTQYKVSYQGPYDSAWIPVEDAAGNVAVFKGNTDIDTHVTNKFSKPVVATKIRILPQAWHNYMSMRFDLLTC